MEAAEEALAEDVLLALVVCVTARFGAVDLGTTIEPETADSSSSSSQQLSEFLSALLHLYPGVRVQIGWIGDDIIFQL